MNATSLISEIILQDTTGLKVCEEDRQHLRKKEEKNKRDLSSCTRYFQLLTFASRDTVMIQADFKETGAMALLSL